VGLCLLVSSIGFRKLVYFISIGYGYAIAAMAVVSLSVAFGTGKPDSIAVCEACILALYGVRLGTYLATRERSATYRASQGIADGRSERAAIGIKFVIWVSVSLLYVAMFMPCIARRIDPLPALSIAGLLVMAAGLAIETIADRQKSRAKRVSPGAFAIRVSIASCPNYFGGTLVWTGNILAGAALLGNWLVCGLAIVGYVCIVRIMIG
jgi:steroid 5-alpha reductase family enzyme